MKTPQTENQRLTMKTSRLRTTSRKACAKCNALNNGEMDRTSRLRGKRNIYSFLCSCGFLQKGKNAGLGSRCILFMESLIEKGFDVRTVVAISRDLRSFFEYIEEKYGITADTSTLERRQVEEYATAVRGAYDVGGKTFTDALDANDLLGAVRLFLLYLHASGAVAEDYGSYVPVIPFPETAEQVQ